MNCWYRLQLVSAGCCIHIVKAADVIFRRHTNQTPPVGNCPEKHRALLFAFCAGSRFIVCVWYLYMHRILYIVRVRNYRTLLFIEYIRCCRRLRHRRCCCRCRFFRCCCRRRWALCVHAPANPQRTLTVDLVPAQGCAIRRFGGWL